jgi:nucleotide-binding universal stress UspA family protein
VYDRILFPTDGSETALAALDYALLVADVHGATLHVLNVANTNRDSVTQVRGEVVDALETEGERAVSEAADHAADSGVPVETQVLQGDPASTIADYAGEYGVDLVVMPTHGRRGLERFLLGSVTERVINATGVPVLAVTPDEQPLTYPVEDVLVATDGSDGARAAVGEAAAVAGAIDATLHVLHVVDTASLGIDVTSALEGETLQAAGEEALEAAREAAAATGFDDVTTALRDGRPYREILDYVEANGVGLLAVGTRGETDFSRYTMGGVASKIVRTSPAPVLLAGERDGE